MNITEIDLNTLVEEVRKVAAEQPYAITKQCNYFLQDDDLGVVTDQPCCIIGHALAKMGVPASEFTYSEPSVMCDGGTNAKRFGLVLVTVKHPEANGDDASVFQTYGPPALQWLSKVQISQDEFNMWGEAVKFADECFG